MENLNAEQVKRGLECLNNKIDRDCDTCPIFWKARKSTVTQNCRHIILDAALALINSQEQRIKELAEEKENLKIMNELCEISEQSLRDLYDVDTTAQSEVISRLIKENEKLTEENERLRAIPEQLHKEMSERMVEEVKTAKKYTVRIMHSEIKERCIKGGIYPAFVASTIDQIAKELTEDGQ